MKIALVNQPIGRVRPFAEHEPFSGGSITLWNYHMARELAGAHDVTVFTRGQGAPGPRTIHGLSFDFVDDGGDERAVGWGARRGKLLRRIGWPPNPRRPFYASEAYYRAFTENTARRIQEGGFDLVSVTNYTHMLPALRRHNPAIKLHLHMQCEWLNQLDPGLIGPRLALCDQVSGCSQFIVDQACRVFPEIAARSFALLNGVDTGQFHPAEAAGSEEPEILYIGRGSPEKGIHFLLEAFNEIVEACPGACLTLIGGRSPAAYDHIVALDPDPLVQDMARFYHRRGSSYVDYLDSIPKGAARGRITYVNDLPQDHLLQAYQRAAVFVFPSAWNEPFGMPVIEAMACGVPVVTTHSGGIPEFVTDQETGLLVARASAPALRDALLALLTDPEKRRRIAAAGRAHVEARLRWRHTARRYLERLA